MAESLADVDKKVAKFFVKADNNNFLQFLLAQKIILVEGATEYLLLPEMFQRIAKQSLEESKVMIISCNGISYDNYLQIAQKTDKKISFISTLYAHMNLRFVNTLRNRILREIA